MASYADIRPRVTSFEQTNYPDNIMDYSAQSSPYSSNSEFYGSLDLPLDFGFETLANLPSTTEFASLAEHQNGHFQTVGHNGAENRKEVDSLDDSSSSLLTATQKRKQQNRTAQRAFRERKEKFISTLQLQVSRLESETSSLREANEVLIHQLKTHFKKNITAGTSTQGLLRHIMNSRFDELEISLKFKAAELLASQQKRYPITDSHYFIDCVQKNREDQLQKSLKKKLREFFPKQTQSLSGQETHSFNLNELVALLAGKTETDVEKLTCSEAIDCMAAYYKGIRQKFVDDFGNLAVEKCLFEPMSVIFTSQTVKLLDDSIISNIAAENERSRQTTDVTTAAT